MSQEAIAIQHRGQEDLLARLKEAQSKFGYVSEEVMAELAESLDTPINDVYGVASFYSFLSIKPLGRNIIRICKSLPCFLKGSDIIVESVKKELGIKLGETTPDGRFSFELTNCIGACDKAPAMMINHDVYGDLTPGEISQILEEYE
jgi:NADH-quinone oxidoreductase E subunit